MFEFILCYNSEIKRVSQKIFTVFFFLFGVNIYAYPQDSYFPLSKGNVWFYAGDPVENPTDLFRISDSIRVNGQLYFLYKGDESNYSDSLFVDENGDIFQRLNTKNYCIYKFSAELSDIWTYPATWNTNTIVNVKYVNHLDNIYLTSDNFSRTYHDVKVFLSIDIDTLEKVIIPDSYVFSYFAKNIGMIYQSWQYSEIKLYGAYVNSTLIKDTTFTSFRNESFRNSTFDRLALHCYPNPFNSQTQISISGGLINKNHELQIFNTMGQLIRQLNTNGNEYTFWNGKSDNGVDQASGIYWVIIKNREFNSRLVKQKIIYIK